MGLFKFARNPGRGPGAILKLTTALATGALMIPPISGAAAAQETPQAAENSDVVIVTARKREEELQDISAAIAIVDDERLAEGGISDVRDLQTIVPSLSVGEVVGLMKINIRGLGNSTNTRSEDPDVVLHVDNAVISRMEAQALAFFDLERIEVLRGPQGTLYGRNSTGGTMNLVTKKPTDTFEGYASATVGSYDLFQVDAAAGGPVNDWLKVRGAIQTVARGGYGKNIGTGNDVDDLKRSAARLHMLFEPSSNIDFLLSVEYATEDDASGFFSYLAPLLPGVTPRGAGGFSDPNSRDAASSIDPQLQRQTWSVTGTLDWELNEDWTFRSITNGRRLDFRIAQDLDTSTVANATVVLIPLDDEQFSEELQLVYAGDRINAIGGLYYFDETFGGRTLIGTGAGQGVFFQLVGDSSTSSFAPFFNVTYALNDFLTFRIGGRYTEENRKITNDSIVNGVLTTTANDISDDERDLSKYTGEYGVDFNLNEDNLLYYTYSEGFRSGAALIFQSNSPIIDPTTVENHEVGYKFQTADGRFSANIAAFAATINNLQRTQASLGPTGLLITRVNNVNELETSGVELDLAWAPTDNFSLTASVANLNAEFKDFVTDDPLVAGNNPIQVAGNVPGLAPEWKTNVHAEYDFDLQNGATLTAMSDVSYVSEQFFDEFNRPPFTEEAYTLFNAGLTYRPSAADWSIALWGKNLSDEKKKADVTFSAFGGVVSKTFIPPRTFGVTARKEF